MRKSLIAAATGLLLLFGASAASANTVTTDFDAMTPGTVDTQEGWSATGPYDQGVVPSAVTGFGTQSLRVSSLLASGSFGDWVFSTPAAQASESTNQGFMSKFSFQALGNQVNGSHLSISPDNGQGVRMSYVRLEDNAAGVQVFFVDTPWGSSGTAFVTHQIATLDRTKSHTIRFDVSLVPGEANDIVNVYVDGVQKACGTTWENYYRYDQEQAGSGNVVSPIDRLIIQARGTSTLALADVPAADRGFLIDNVTTTTTQQGQAVACPLPVDPQAGVQGTTGTQGATGHTGAQGAAGAAGTTTVIHETATPTLVGNTIRPLNAPLRRGEKFVSLRAYLLTPSGLHRLPARRRAISVDLRNKPVGNYNIIIKARYRKSNGVVHTVRTTRNLSVAVA